MSSDAPIPDIDALREMIRAKGMRATSARLAVLSRLISATSPLTHSELSDDLTSLGIDRATVFRNLNDLTEAGLATRTELGDHVWRFEARDPDDPDAARHPHFMCVECGSVTCMSDVTFDTKTARRAEKLGQVTEVLLKGHCHECLSAG